MENFGALLGSLSAQPSSTRTEKQSSGDSGDFNNILESLMQNASAQMLRKTGVSAGAQKLLPTAGGEDVATEDLITAKVSDINEILENLIMQIKADTPISDSEMNFGTGDLATELELVFADFTASGASETEKMDAMIKYINELVSTSESASPIQNETTNAFEDVLTSLTANQTEPKPESANLQTKDNAETVKPLPELATIDSELLPNDEATVQNVESDLEVVANVSPNQDKSPNPEPLNNAKTSATESVRQIDNTERGASEIKQAPVAATDNMPKNTPTIDNQTTLSKNSELPQDDGVNVKVQAEQPEKNTVAVEKNSRINVIENVAADKKQMETVKPSEMPQTEQKQEVRTTSSDQRESLRAAVYEKSSVLGDSTSSSGQKGGESGAFAKSANGAVTEQAKLADSNTESKGTTFDSLLKLTSESVKSAESAEAALRSKPIDLTDTKDISRLINKIQSVAVKGEAKLTVTLTPENLGRLEIRLTESGGRLTAKLLADNESAHKLMVSNAEAIKSQLTEKGIVIDNMEFSFSDTAKQESNENKRASAKHSTKKMMKDEDEGTVDFGKEIATNDDRGLYA